MIFQFTYDITIQGVIVAPDIEGTAEIAVDADGDWTVAGISLDEFTGDRSVILPDDHPLCTDIKLWLLQHRRNEIDEAVGETLVRNDPNAEHRHSIREMV